VLIPRCWIGVGILPPHVQETRASQCYADTLIVAGAAAIFSNIEQLSLVEIQELLWVEAYSAPAPT